MHAHRLAMWWDETVIVWLAHTGPGMKGVDRPRGIEPLSTRPTLR